MTKYFLVFILFPSLFLVGCLDSSEGDDRDLQAPTISTTGVATPGQFAEVSSQADRIQLAFEVTDDAGLSEVVLESHNGFDGHVHVRSVNNDFVLLAYRHTVTQEDLADPLRFSSRADDDITLYLDDRNPLIPTDALVLAGPYHFSIKAADVSGNETSYDDNSTYHTTFYLQRDYAPQFRVDNVDRSAGTVNGQLYRNGRDSASANIVFLWAYIVTPDAARPSMEGEIGAEWIWGESNWPHQFRPDSGAPLPNDQLIELSELLKDQEAIQQMSTTDQLRLWAEDENGNISVHTFN